MVAVHFENLLFLVFIFVAFLFQLLMRAATKAGKGSSQPKPGPSTTRPPVPRAQAETDEDRIRKFLEALGQPEGSPPPPLVQPRPTYQKPIIIQHVPPFATPLPPLTTRPPDLPPKVAVAPAFEVHQVTTPVKPVPVKAAPEQRSLVQVSTPGTQPEGNFAELLKSTSGLREAIILREIFGPPRSMQSPDLV